MSEKRAYYIEYPDKEFTVMLKIDGDEEQVNTYEGPVQSAHFIAVLMTDGYEVHAHTSEQYQSDVHEWKTNRSWQPIDPLLLEEVTLGTTGPDGKMYAKRRQLRGGQVVEANDNPDKGQSFWHIEGDAPKRGVEIVPLPKEYAQARDG